MGASASVVQEYFKAVDYWADIADKKDWKLAIWIVGQNDVDLVDRFQDSSKIFSSGLTHRMREAGMNIPNACGRNMLAGFQRKWRKNTISSRPCGTMGC